MAILKEPTVNRVFDTGEETPPRGTFVATCIDIKDMFGVERPKYENPSELERVDLTAFLFGFRDREGRPFKIASKTMRISAKENSNLFAFLKSWLGRAPQYGWDYCEMKGQKALITVDHTPSRKYAGVVYADIVTISPVPEGFGAPAPACPAEPEGRSGAPVQPPDNRPPLASSPRTPPASVAPPRAAVPAPVDDTDEPFPF
jgi:hypothetical protein